MQVPSMIRSFFPSLTSPNPLKKPIYEQTERIINSTYLILLSLATAGIASGVFLSFSFPLLGASICLISLVICSCLLVLFPLLPDIAKTIARKRIPTPITTPTPLQILTKRFQSINFWKTPC